MTSTPDEPINLTIKPTLNSVLVDTTRDAIMIMKGCIDGLVPCIPGRPPERERKHVIISGSVFVYEEALSGIKRWTDSVSWSPSRAFTNMLVYREVKDKFKTGSRKVLKRTKPSNYRRYPYGRPSSSDSTDPNIDPSIDPSLGASSNQERESVDMDPELQGLDPERRKHVVGSLTDSYEFKPAGLCKKTLSICYEGRNYHLVGYYAIRDVVNGSLKRPLDAYPALKQVDIQDILAQNIYKFDIDSSGYYSSNPVKGEDENFRYGESRQCQDYSIGYDSPSSDVGLGLQSMNISSLGQMDHIERQLPPLLHQDVTHGGYHQFSADNEWSAYYPPRNQFAQQQHQFSQQQQQQQQYPPNHQQIPIASGENNFFVPPPQQYPHPVVTINQQPRVMPDDPSFGFDPNLPFARHANMEPHIPILPSSANRGRGMDLSQYRIGRRDESEGETAQNNNFHRPGATLQVSLGSNPPWNQVLITTPSNLQSAIEENHEFSPQYQQPQPYNW